jgi:hypothetical protein
MAADLNDFTIQDIYAALVNDVPRNEMIANDILRAVESGSCPLLLTGRTEHLQYFAAKLAGVAKHVFILKGGMGKKQRREPYRVPLDSQDPGGRCAAFRPDHRHRP